MSDHWPYIRYRDPDAIPADKIRQLMAELGAQIDARAERAFELGAGLDDERIAAAERRGYLKCREAAAKWHEDQATAFA